MTQTTKGRMNQQIISAIKIALAEDIGSGDVTTLSIVPAEQKINGRFLVKADGIIAGLDVVTETFQQVDPNLVFSPTTTDGSAVSKGDIIATISGHARSILQAERVALNFLQRMSGIATMTRQFVDAATGTKAKILDTRKTAPGLRMADKLAVQLGGGMNHRIGLFDMALIKENHIAAAGSIHTAVNRVKATYPNIPIEVEVTNLDELKEALSQPVDRIMLDNMSLEAMKTAVQLTNGKIDLEASGNVSLATVRNIALTGIDYISSGALTHSVTALDISLRLSQ
ncbi:MAG: carboxylating nicotinate-nucleotide diphosphorylase [Chloroflexota bacterium]